MFGMKIIYVVNLDIWVGNFELWICKLERVVILFCYVVFGFRGFLGDIIFIFVML